MADFEYSDTMLIALGDMISSFNEKLSDYDARIDTLQAAIDALDDTLAGMNAGAAYNAADPEMDFMINDLMNGQNIQGRIMNLFGALVPNAQNQNMESAIAAMQRMQQFSDSMNSRLLAEQQRSTEYILNMCRDMLDAQLAMTLNDQAILIENLERLGVLAQAYGLMEEEQEVGTV